jgi:hypothetical protein
MQPRQQPAIGECRQRSDGEQAVRALGAQSRGGFAQEIEAGGQLGKIVAATVREHEPARQPLEQAGVEVLLEPANLLAHGGGRYAQLRGGGHEAAEARGSLEGAQGVEWGKTSGHGTLPAQE